ncbi:unnamed protein product [Blumeria hordei]|uniref:Uncharacterized protein n=1 Tax=Blumeria hordei TaxID=2867405 RepID=A0A383UL48_BLUHO|nr:unnamed protein product [Blumeria hordei]
MLLPPQVSSPLWNARQLVMAVQRVYTCDKYPKTTAISWNYQLKQLNKVGYLNYSCNGRRENVPETLTADEQLREKRLEDDQEFRSSDLSYKSPLPKWPGKNSSKEKGFIVSPEPIRSQEKYQPTSCESRDELMKKLSQESNRSPSLPEGYEAATKSEKLASHNIGLNTSINCGGIRCESLMNNLSPYMEAHKNVEILPELDLPTATKAQSSLSTRAPSHLRPETDTETLFDIFFPPKTTKNHSDQSNAEAKLEKLPVFQWKSTSKEKIRSKKNILSDEQKESLTLKLSTTKPMRSELLAPAKYGVLYLTACSGTLEESDFFRLGLKGKHIEGWKNGIVRVIPVRHEHTLQFQGSYFIFFTCQFTAKAYHSRVWRLHKLSRIRGLRKPFLIPLKTDLMPSTKEFDKLLDAFSLVPGYARLSIKYLIPPYQGPLRKIMENGSPVSLLQRQANAEFLVLFYLDCGQVNLHQLSEFINDDGRRRNLHWNLAGGHAAIVDLQQEELTVDTDTGVSSTSNLVNGGAGHKKFHQKPSRYVIPFAGEYEARRFVREWHRRPFPLREKRSLEDSFRPIINAEVLW